MEPQSAPTEPIEPIEVLIEAITDAERFVSATWSGALPGATPSAERVTLRPVDLKVGRRLQLSVFDGRATAVTNLEPTELATRLDELFETGFASTFVRTLDADLQLSHARGGAPRLTRHRPSASTIATSHDRPKARLLDESAPFLRAVGITDQHGRIKPTARAKHRQVERFVEILSHTLDADLPATIRAVDLGCGAGVLTLATYHYLTEVRGHSVTMTGIDTKADLIERLNTTVAELGWDGLTFEAGSIIEHQPAEPPDLVLALHACDTATDDALSKAVGWRARYVLAAPCCQHDLQAQIDTASGAGRLRAAAPPRDRARTPRRPPDRLAARRAAARPRLPHRRDRVRLHRAHREEPDDPRHSHRPTRPRSLDRGRAPRRDVGRHARAGRQDRLSTVRRRRPMRRARRRAWR